MAADDIIDPKWTDELRIYGEGFVGRQTELEAMDRAWAEGARIFALHAEGGAGKTRVVVEWLLRMRDAGWRGTRRVFVHSFYSQGSDERRNASSDLFFEQALKYFGHKGEPITHSDERGRILGRLLIETHGLLILDGLEPLQHPPLHAERGRLKDPGITRLLLSLASAAHDGQPGLCLITSRQPIIELQGRLGTTVRQQSLEHLRSDDGAELLRQFEVAGSNKELRKASDEFQGHAYSLMLLGSYLRNATDHNDIHRRCEVVLLEEETETKHPGHAQRMFAAYVRCLGKDSPEVAVLRLLGFFDRAAEQELLKVLRAREGIVYEWSGEEPTHRRSEPKFIKDLMPEIAAPLLDLSQAQWNRILNRLRNLRLISFSGQGTLSAIDAHPLLRECFAEQVRIAFPDSWLAGHRRLFEHLTGSIPYWPEGMEGLKPLYQAVIHGCLAGLHERARAEIYRDRIMRGGGEKGYYSTRKIGATGADLGAVACFFANQWTTLASDLSLDARAWLLNDAAMSLEALGRLTEAVEPMRTALEMYIAAQSWRPAAYTAANFNLLQLNLGNISTAVAGGEQAIHLADRSNDALIQVASRANLANALNQAGRQDESLRLFTTAEFQHKQHHPEHPQLYSLQGFHLCDVLLAKAERMAWQRHLHKRQTCQAEGNHNNDCEAAIERAHNWIEWRIPEISLADAALTELTLGRCSLYRTTPVISTSHSAHINSAVKAFRESGQLSQLPNGLLTRAWLRHLSGDSLGAREDLDEAREIADRGPMPLLQVDILLTRARLFRDRTALAEARHLIEKHSYHRRDGELADAEEAACGWNSKSLNTGTQEPNMTSPTPRFDIALSFPGEHRSTIEQVAEHLSVAIGRTKILYDKYYEAEFARIGLDVYLPRLYREQSNLIAIFLCPEYARKRWCQLEWRHIRQLIATVDADRIMLLSLGSPGDLSELGIMPGDGHVDVSHLPTSEIANLILQRLDAKTLPSVPVIATTSSKPENAAVSTWKEKLAYFQEQEAITADPEYKFRLRKLIEEAQQKISENEEGTP